jgi:hypothetical protein
VFYEFKILKTGASVLTNLGAKAPTTNLGAKAPTTNLGAKAPTTNLGAFYHFKNNHLSII